jgi:hypothetical protein
MTAEQDTPYHKLGFEPTGEMEGIEEVARFTL